MSLSKNIMVLMEMNTDQVNFRNQMIISCRLVIIFLKFESSALISINTVTLFIRLRAFNENVPLVVIFHVTNQKIRFGRIQERKHGNAIYK